MRLQQLRERVSSTALVMKHLLGDMFTGSPVELQTRCLPGREKPQEAKQELSEGLRALDHKGENRLPASAVVTALKRMGIELLKKPKDVERALRVFEVRGGEGGGGAPASKPRMFVAVVVGGGWWVGWWRG